MDTNSPHQRGDSVYPQGEGDSVYPLGEGDNKYDLQQASKYTSKYTVQLDDDDLESGDKNDDSESSDSVYEDVEGNRAYTTENGEAYFINSDDKRVDL